MFVSAGIDSCEGYISRWFYSITNRIECFLNASRCCIVRYLHRLGAFTNKVKLIINTFSSRINVDDVEGYIGRVGDLIGRNIKTFQYTRLMMFVFVFSNCLYDTLLCVSHSYTEYQRDITSSSVGCHSLIKNMRLRVDWFSKILEHALENVCCDIICCYHLLNW